MFALIKHAYVGGKGLHRDDSDAIRKINNGGAVDLILVNAAKASFADLIVVHRSRDLIHLVQAKREKRLSSDTVREELSKMGKGGGDLPWFGFVDKMRKKHRKRQSRPKSSPKPKKVNHDDSEVKFHAGVIQYLREHLPKDIVPSNNEIITALKQKRRWEALRTLLIKNCGSYVPIEPVDISAIRQLLLKPGSVRYVIFQHGKEPPDDVELKEMKDVDIIFAPLQAVTVAGNQFAQLPLFPITVPPTGARTGVSERAIDQLHNLGI
jgi:hypothetical protein